MNFTMVVTREQYRLLEDKDGSYDWQALGQTVHRHPLILIKGKETQSTTNELINSLE